MNKLGPRGMLLKLPGISLVYVSNLLLFIAASSNCCKLSDKFPIFIITLFILGKCILDIPRAYEFTQCDKAVNILFRCGIFELFYLLRDVIKSF